MNDLKEKFHRVPILIPNEIYPELVELALKNRRKISPFIVDLIYKAIEDNKQNPK